MLCLNDSLFFLKPIVVSQKEKKRGGPMLGTFWFKTLINDWKVVFSVEGVKTE